MHCRALRDDQWDRIREFLSGCEGWVDVTAADNRVFIEVVLYRYCSGIPWRNLPARFDGWKNLHRRFSRWAKSGVWRAGLSVSGECPKVCVQVQEPLANLGESTVIPPRQTTRRQENTTR
jgi:hypothetical protein